MAIESFAIDIINACRAEVGADFPIILRWSQWKQQDYARLAPTRLATFGALGRCGCEYVPLQSAPILGARVRRF